MWIVATSSAKMPSSCWGKYKNVAIMNVHYWLANDASWSPRLLSDRAKGCYKNHNTRSGFFHLGHFAVGKTKKCAYEQAKIRAQQMADRLNSLTPEAAAQEIMTWGGSA